MTSETAFFVVGAAVLALAALAYLARAAYQGNGFDDEEEVTVRERPTLLPGNANLVAVLYTVADDIEVSGQRVAGGLRDIARVIQLNATEPVAAGLRARIAAFVRGNGAVHSRAAQRIEEGA
jgi:hypothetical protein